ncbi:MAG TPA: site-2 protease family protein [Solirubrobacteraceae bacterium]|nr:site-2 protease family protein [Solirubrobacteraceae bacterium]
MDWLLTILGIMALIVLHEAGHFAVAKATGMRVERFSLFFPPKIVGVRRGETEYVVGAIPAGGYVKITGMSPEEVADLPPEVARRAYYSQPPWKRIVVILAGPGVNLLIAFLLFWGVLLVGSFNGALSLEGVAPGVRTLGPEIAAVGGVEAGMPATGVLRAGDRLVAIDGRAVDPARAIQTISSHRCVGTPTEGCRASKAAIVKVRRDGRDLTLAIAPRYDGQAKRMVLGFRFVAPPVRAFGPLAAAGVSLREMWSMTTTTFEGLGKALTSSKQRKQLSSIVGITRVTEQAVAEGPGRAFVVIGYVSLVLAVLNLLPFLPLDGGHVLWAVAEKLRGRRVSLTAMWRFSSIGIALLVFLVISGFSNDIGRLGG